MGSREKPMERDGRRGLTTPHRDTIFPSHNHSYFGSPAPVMVPATLSEVAIIHEFDPHEIRPAPGAGCPFGDAACELAAAREAAPRLGDAAGSA